MAADFRIRSDRGNAEELKHEMSPRWIAQSHRDQVLNLRPSAKSAAELYSALPRWCCVFGSAHPHGGDVIKFAPCEKMKGTGTVFSTNELV